jgi:DNA-directed RNA polymerase subunit RPC12/RpoP
MGFSIDMKPIICWECGGVFAFPGGIRKRGCPYCQERTIIKQDRTISGLRGEITKLKKRLKG